ncbi:MAG: cytidine deaminase, partial [Planctomycetota bacterium]
MKELIKKAIEAREKSYSPYSHFKVGAALKTTSGKVYAGTNVENASYGLTVCAERVAVYKAVSEGEREFEALAVFTEADELTPPCGACRQVLWEFSKNLIQQGISLEFDDS